MQHLLVGIFRSLQDNPGKLLFKMDHSTFEIVGAQGFLPTFTAIPNNRMSQVSLQQSNTTEYLPGQ